MNDGIDLSEVVRVLELLSPDVTYESTVRLWSEDPDAARELIYLTPDTVSLPYNSQALLLKRLRSQFFTLTAMQRAELSSASL